MFRAAVLSVGGFRVSARFLIRCIAAVRGKCGGVFDMLYTMTSTIVEMFVVRDGGIALVEKVVGLGSVVRGFRLGSFPNCW